MEFIKLTIEFAVAKITLNRPEMLNSFNRQMAVELQNTLDYCAENNMVRSIFIIGEGRGFCAGQDLQEAIAPSSEIGEIVRNTYNPIVRKIRTIEKPIICAVNGVAAGAGANIAFCCDITFAAESANFIQSFSNIGLIPDSGGTYTLSRLVGMKRATALTMLGTKLTAKEAESYGLIWKVLPDDQLESDAYAIALKLASMPTKGFGLTKRAFNNGLFNDFDDQLDLEEKLQSEAGKTADYIEGVNAFLEKRKASFKGE